MTSPLPNSSPELTEARSLAAEIMVKMRQARFPKDYPAEAHDEFEALTLTPMLAQALSSKNELPCEIEGLVEELATDAKTLVKASVRLTYNEPDLADEIARAKVRCQRAAQAILSLQRRLAAVEEALRHWDGQATCWLGTRAVEAHPGWMKPAIDKGRAALGPKDTGHE